MTADCSTPGPGACNQTQLTARGNMAWLGFLQPVVCCQEAAEMDGVHGLFPGCWFQVYECFPSCCFQVQSCLPCISTVHMGTLYWALSSRLDPGTHGAMHAGWYTCMQAGGLECQGDLRRT